MHIDLFVDWFIVVAKSTLVDSVLALFGRRDRKFRVAIKLASRPDLHQLQEFLRRKQRDAPYETIQVLDVVLRDLPSQKYVKNLNIYSIGLNID